MILRENPKNKHKEAVPLSYVSDNGKWFVELQQLIFTRRVVIRHFTEAEGIVRSYCGGANPVWQCALFNAVVNAFAELPEEVSARELEKLFPKQKYKPMGNDPDCWRALLAISNTSAEESSAARTLMNEQLGGVNGEGPKDNGRSYIRHGDSKSSEW